MSPVDPATHEDPSDRRLDLASARESYQGKGLDALQMAANWWEQLDLWLDEAADSGLAEPSAMVLATVSPSGVPATRTVLCKGLDRSGAVFFTNRQGRKGRHLAANPRAAATFSWVGLARQVTLIGSTQPVGDTESDEYFASRPRGSQLGAWASHQSEVIASRDVMVRQMAAAEERFGNREVERPGHWGGYRLRPVQIEFWQGRPNRLHDRLRYVNAQGSWKIQRLSA